MALPLAPQLIEDQAASIASQDLKFTKRQLYYAVCRAVEAPEASSSGWRIMAGAILTIGGAIASALGSLYLVVLVILGILLFASGMERRRFEKNRPHIRARAYSYSEFERVAAQCTLPGIIDMSKGESSPVADGAPIVVCDSAETAAFLRANCSNCSVVLFDDVGSLVTGKKVFAIHDADIEGCRLRSRLTAAAADVIDCGLRPQATFARPIAVIEAAPIALSGLSRDDVSADEIVWLANGNRVELAALPPAELLDLVRSRVGS